MADIHNTSVLIKAEALRLGFSQCGLSSISTLEKESIHLKDWLAKGYQAQMDYMNNHFQKRVDPSLLVPNALSVISVSLNYFPGNIESNKHLPKISKYAIGRDYHKVMKQKLKQLFQYISSLDPHLKGRYFVDSAPVMDKAWAVKSGLGWMGKNGNIIHKKHGSFFFIGEIVCNLPLEDDIPVPSYCGSCQLCIDHCPTKAIVQPYVIDANRCISYQTIENKNPIPEDLLSNINNYIFGCDICQDVCPWNHKSILTSIADFGTKKDLLKMTFEDYKSLSEEDFNQRFEGSPVKRAGYQKIMRTIEQIQNYKSDL